MHLALHFARAALQVVLHLLPILCLPQEVLLNLNCVMMPIKCRLHYRFDAWVVIVNDHLVPLSVPVIEHGLYGNLSGAVYRHERACSCIVRHQVWLLAQHVEHFDALLVICGAALEGGGYR